MKKLLFAAMLAVSMVAGSVARAEDYKILDRILLYVPNRVLDVLDTFTLNVGAGPMAEISLQGTQFLKFGAGGGLNCKLVKACNRQYGAGIESGWYWAFGPVGEENRMLDCGTSLVGKYLQMHAGFPDPTERIYDFYKGERDYWAIGGSLAALIGAELYIHPIEWVDLALGIILIDPKGDDLIFDDFR